MRRFTLLTLVLMLAAGAFVWAGGGQEQAPEEEQAQEQPAEEEKSRFEGQTLTVSRWGFNMDLIRENIRKPFEEKYGVKIVYETGNNSSRLTKMVTRKDNPKVDVVLLAGNYTYQAIEKGLLEPYDPEKLENLGQLYEWAQDPLGGNYGVGYAVIAYGLVYRQDKIDEPVTSWKDLLREDLDGYVTVPEITTTFGPATIVMLAEAYGGDIDNPQPGWDAMERLSDNLVTTYRRSSELVSFIQQGEVWLAPYANYAWGMIKDTGQDLKRVIPEEGLVASQSVASIVKGTDNRELAHKYIDFIISRKVQKAEAVDLVDSPTNTTVELPSDVADMLVYGDEQIGSLRFLDQEKLMTKQETWIEKWNDIVAK